MNFYRGHYIEEYPGGGGVVLSRNEDVWCESYDAAYALIDEMEEEEW